MAAPYFNSSESFYCVLALLSLNVSYTWYGPATVWMCYDVQNNALLWTGLANRG